MDQNNNESKLVHRMYIAQLLLVTITFESRRQNSGLAIEQFCDWYFFFEDNERKQEFVNTFQGNGTC